MRGPACIFWANLTPFSLQRSFDGAVEAGVELVVVDNTHTRRRDYEGYEATAAAAGYAVVIEELRCDSVAAALAIGRRGTHGVPDTAVAPGEGRAVIPSHLISFYPSHPIPVDIHNHGEPI
jgi:hypothetical protein